MPALLLHLRLFLPASILYFHYINTDFIKQSLVLPLSYVKLVSMSAVMISSTKIYIQPMFFMTNSEFNMMQEQDDDGSGNIRPNISVISKTYVLSAVSTSKFCHLSESVHPTDVDCAAE